MPADAGLVIVANPRPPVGAALQRALRDYLTRRKGKAVFLFDIPPRDSGEKTIPATGLEGLLGEFDVEVTNERIYSAELLQIGQQVVEDHDFLILGVSTELVQAGNELAKAFQRRNILTKGVRVIRPGRTAANPSLKAEALLTTMPGASVWTETDMTVNPAKTLAEMEQQSEGPRPVVAGPLPAAVLVTETAAPNPAPGSPPPAAKPRLVVFGDTTFATNGLVAESSPSPRTSPFSPAPSIG